MKFKIIKLLIFFFAFIFLSDIRAVKAVEPATINRTILAIFDSKEPINRSTDYNLICKNAEVILNYLGMKVRYHDINKGLPAPAEMEDIHGILTWFEDDEMIGANSYCEWLAVQIKSEKKCVILRNFGALKNSKTGELTPLPVVNKVFNEMSLEYSGNWSDNPFLIELIDKNKNMVEFERTLTDELTSYVTIKSLDANNHIYLRLKRKDIADSESALVVTTARGGIAMEGYELFINYEDDKFRWRINPFLFFEEAFGIKKFPKYDTTTLFGRRIFYSHIDGDGFRNVSRIDVTRVCPEIIKDEILTKYNIPITASFITAEVDPAFLGSKKFKRIAKEIAMLRNVEIGVHGFTHPLDWNKQLSVFEIKGYSRKMETKEDLGILSESFYANAVIIPLTKEEFIKGEIIDAVNYVDTEIMPRGKKSVLYQWTGNCRPGGDCIKAVQSINIANINGGDSRLDSASPSYTTVSPLSRQVDESIQIHTSNANENIYTSGWTGGYGALKKVIETFEQTEIPSLIDSVPRRISAMNIYYHFYSGEWPQSLAALKTIYEYVLSKPIIPIFTSYYTKIVEGFFNGKIKKMGDGALEFFDYGSCRTVRIEGENIYPDLSKSVNILGFNKWEKYTYIHLADTEKAVLYFASIPPREPYLKESSFVIKDFKIDVNSVSFLTRNFGENGYIAFTNMAPNSAYTADIQKLNERKEKYKINLWSDNNGGLTCSIPWPGEFLVYISKEGKA
ncbi:conserved hypothetical protein, secreted [Candidatus Omnitrophus magneticus]|uniref:Uncharacterized protein n=1 Tax=Candidatus Omnitrophus magneticus TaxID=1609969 RepID=A0A0F0CKH3_9BACT|nr:conserved hypothetical protein, secreted [Candidatus Omnitrophus magneticus]